MSFQHIQKNFPGLLHTPATYEKYLPYGCEAIVKRKWGSGGSGSRFSHKYKQTSLVEHLMNIWEKEVEFICFTLWHILQQVGIYENIIFFNHIYLPENVKMCPVKVLQSEILHTPM